MAYVIGHPPTSAKYYCTFFRVECQGAGRAHLRARGRARYRAAPPAGLAAGRIGRATLAGFGAFLVRENPNWEILNDAGVDPVPERASITWGGFLRPQAEVLLACDFLETVTLGGAPVVTGGGHLPCAGSTPSGL